MNSLPISPKEHIIKARSTEARNQGERKEPKNQTEQREPKNRKGPTRTKKNRSTKRTGQPQKNKEAKEPTETKKNKTDKIRFLCYEFLLNSFKGPLLTCEISAVHCTLKL